MTCVCGTDVPAREALVRTLDSGSCAVAEYDDFEDALMLEEFGDFLCTAVVVLDEDVDRRVASASRGLGAGKHVLVGPWAPALTISFGISGAWLGTGTLVVRSASLRTLWEPWPRASTPVLRPMDQWARCRW